MFFRAIPRGSQVGAAVLNEKRVLEIYSRKNENNSFIIEILGNCHMTNIEQEILAFAK